MTKNEIIGAIASSGMLRTIIQNIGGTTDEDLKDLEQDIYLVLFTKDEKTLNDLYTTGQMKYYLARIAANNIHSTTSPFYTTYKKPKINAEPLNEKDDDDD